MKKLKNRVPRNYWNIETMQKYCDEYEFGYKVIEIKQIDKVYQNQLWAYVQCDNLSHEPYWVWWNNFLNSYLCKQCYYDKNNITSWDTQKIIDFYKIYGLELLDLNEWKSVDDNMTSRDDLGFKYIMSITALKQYGKSSFKFNKFNKYSLENLHNFCKIYRSDYRLISDKYIGIKEIYEFEYIGNLLPLNEDSKFYMTADCFVNGFCIHPYFSTPKGVLYFESRLKALDIKYKKEYTYEKCKDKYVLPFDIYIFHTNEIIEIDGDQHRRAVNGWGGEDQFKYIQKHDEIKNNFCNDNNIKLTRIPYVSNKYSDFVKNADYKINEIMNTFKTISPAI